MSQERKIEKAPETGGGTGERAIITAKEADAARVSPETQLRLDADKTKTAVQTGATDQLWNGAGKSPEEVTKQAAKLYGATKTVETVDPRAKVVEGTLTFESPKYQKPLDAIAPGATVTGDNKLATAGTLQVGDQGIKGDKVKINDKDKVSELNRVGEIDKSKDNPEAVTKRFDTMVDGINLKGVDAAGAQKAKDDMKAQFRKDMEDMQKRLGAGSDDMTRVMHSMNNMMDRGNVLPNDGARVNAVAGLAARGANPEEANRQGGHPTCALTSESRVEQQRDFAKYAEQMGSVAARGYAYRGGENGQPVTKVDINSPETRGANLAADSEASQLYNKNIHQTGGQRDYLGQLDNALIGTEMSKNVSKDAVYVTANAGRLGGETDQGSNSGGLFVKDGQGNLKQVQARQEDGTLKGVTIPPTSPDQVAQLNYANGGGGIFIHENMAKDFQTGTDKNGKPTYPPGMNVFKDAEDLRAQLKDKPGEYQILTNGVKVAGKEGHGLHAQTVQLKGGELEFGNNWESQFNHQKYNDKQIAEFTNPANWKDYKPSFTHPNGTPDWRHEQVGPKTDNNMAKNKPDDKTVDDKKTKDDKDKETEEQKRKNAAKAQEREQDQAQAMAAFQKQHAQWQYQKEHDPNFNEPEPVYKPNI